MSTSFEYDRVDVFTAGFVGEPGQRTFFFQARSGGRSVSVKCEKQHVAALAEYVTGMLADLPQPGPLPHPVTLALTEPIIAEWTVGSIGIAFDNDRDRFVLVVEEVAEEDDEGEPLLPEGEDRGSLRLMLTREQAAAFCTHAEAAVAAGRPPCRFCGRPLNPGGHLCPRMN
jgi:uncharacterized repeat protein (TIGR03847 family)